MTDASPSVAYRRESRRAKPFDASEAVEKALEQTTLQFGDRSLLDGDVATVEVGQLPTPPVVYVRVDTKAVTDLCDEWSMSGSDLEVVLLVEARMLNLLERIDVSIDWSTPPAQSSPLEVALPAWVNEAIGRTRLGVRLYLVLGRERDAVTPDQAAAKGSVLAAWEVALDMPDAIHWFTPSLLTAEVRERLQMSCSSPISPATLIYVTASNLLQPGVLADSVQVYLEPEIVGLLDTLRPGAAIRMLEMRIAYDVLQRILEQIKAEVDEYSPPDVAETAAFPFLSLLAEQVGCEPGVVLERIEMGAEELEALRTHLQKVTAVLATARSAIRGDSQ